MKTSVTDPIRVDFVDQEAHGLPGRIGLTIAPGKKDRPKFWDRDLAEDLRRLHDHYLTDLLISLMEDHEYQLLGIAGLASAALEVGITVLRLPIPDVSIPAPHAPVSELVGKMLDAVAKGRTVVVHCRGGLGRSGLIVACCLVSRGRTPKDAIAAVRAARSGAIETMEQEEFVVRFSGALANTGPDKEKLLSRFRGCLLGGALGDALGYPIEFSSGIDIARRHPVAPSALPVDSSGEAKISDDTQMTLFTAEGVIRAHQRYRDHGICDPREVLLHAYQRWYFTQTGHWMSPRGRGFLVDEPRLHARRAPGNTCISALSQSEHRSLPTVDSPPNNSKGCGAVMRAAPIGLGMIDRQTAFELGRDSGVLTHGHPSGYLSAAFFAVLVFDLVRGRTLSGAIDNAIVLCKPELGSQELMECVEHAVAIALKGSPDPMTIESLGGGWVGEEALAIALLCALTADTSTPAGVNAALWRAVAHSGDSDSTGAITGNLLGAMVGVERLDATWLDRIELRDVVERLADDLFSVTILEHQLDTDSYPPN